MNDSSMHCFWLESPDGPRVRIAMWGNDLSLTVMLPDDSHLVITADRVVYLRGDYMLTLDEWSFEPPEQPYEDDRTNRVYAPGERPGLG